jgi:hypothetical protein
MKNENFITILGWMVNELKLQGNELLCYALIYGFSQDGSSVFNGSRKYIADLIGAKSLNTVDSVLKNLVDKKLIIKESNNINGVIFNSYKVIIKKTNFKTCAPHSNFEHPHSKIEHNNNSNIDSNKEKEIDKSISSKKSDDDAFVDHIYDMYPTKCPCREKSLGKSIKDKKLIKRLLSVYSKEEIEAVVKKEIEEKYGKSYMRNFSTFLNNFPDPSCVEAPVPTPTESKDTICINGQIYR